MKSNIIVTLFASVALADFPLTTGGSGPHTAYYFQDASLPNHTIYQPRDPAGLKLPVIVWGNGACYMYNGTYQSNLLAEVASYGAFAISYGNIKGYDDPTWNTKDITYYQHPEALRTAVTWIKEQAGKGNYTHVDSTRIAAWGMSCGGIEAMNLTFDGDISSIGIFNSGHLNQDDRLATAAKTTKPIFYVMGGPTDIAYSNGWADYQSFPASTPAWFGNHALGHAGAFDLPNAGPAGVAGVKMMQWLLRGNQTAAKWFTDGSALHDGFVNFTSRSLDTIRVTPVGQALKQLKLED